jgi:DNA-binding XRE family transcriptional regulator
MRQPEVVKLLGEKWGREVTATRTRYEMTQHELAERCGVTQQTISKIEMGAILPTDELKVVMSLRLATTPDTLFAWPQQPALVKAVAR